MARHPRRFIAVLPLLAFIAACEATKSSTPTSPSVAGPIPGVAITAPLPLEPQAGNDIAVDNQPVTLVVQNSTTNGVRPLSYWFEIATDAGFTNKVFTRDGVAQGDGGRTSLKLPDPLEPGRTYYWRAQARDGANESAWASPNHFNVITPVTIQAPRPLYPVSNAQVGTTHPEFVVENAQRSGPVGSLYYRFEVSGNESYTAIMVIVTVAEQPNQTKFTLAYDPPYDAPIFWRVRAHDQAGFASPWSNTQQFRTPAKPPLPPPPQPQPPPGGGPPPPGGYPNNGPAIINYVASQYPDKLACCVSSSERVANMEFLRDRVIEAGICGGLKLAWNQKRGVGPRSIDALAQDVNGSIIVIDIGAAYDDTSQSLHLQWIEVPGPPGWDPYPAFQCK
ncbi:MAG: hypothetical protein HYX76_03960 [Acidobacteria bacterium]|nr:hypothetical protein [Acidobacteriota bacterium]